MLEQAIALHRQGRLPEAEQAYRAILARDPANAEVGHLLGTLALDAGLPQAAVPILEHVVTLQPANPAFHVSLGTGYAQAGRPADALRSFDQALTLDDGFFPAHFQRGIALMEPEPEAALASLGRAVALQPESAPAHNYRAIVLTHLGRFDDAFESFSRALEHARVNPMAHSNCGAALVRLGRHADALPHLEAAVALEPDNGELHYNLAGPLMALDRLNEALAVLDRAVALKPGLADAQVNRGLVLTRLGRATEALACFDRAIALAPDLLSAHTGRSGALVAAGRIDEALAYNRELTKNPAFKSEAEFSSAFLLLQRGDWEEGWKLYEARRTKENPVTMPRYPQPEWLGGEAVEGKTIYVYGEQGLGDIIHFSRYLPLLRARGAKVVFSPQDKLARLMQSLDPALEILPNLIPPPQFDYHTPLMSMPLAFGTQPDSLPAQTPYLHAEPALVEKWWQRIGADGFKIGICWTGSNNTDMGIDRSFPLKALAPLAAIPGVRFISLQQVDGLDQLADLPSGMTVETLGDDFDSGPDAFVDTAAAMQSLDLIISCDTSVAHLAGALGRPCWTALKHQPEWRWTLQEKTTPWYPGMSLFRQDAPGDWASVFAAMAATLKAQQA
jgi:tetratricopeptide (TPR) repeat protein